MKRNKSLKQCSLWAFAALAAVVCLTSPATATTPQALDIKVTISATKDLTVNTTHYNFGALNANTAAVSASSITVTNAANGLISTYTIQGADATSTGGGSTWQIVASTGATDEYVLAGQFSNAQPANTDAAWSSDSMTESAVACTATVFGNGTALQSGGGVVPLPGQSARALWFRIITPLVVTDTTQRNATITLAVQ